MEWIPDWKQSSWISVYIPQVADIFVMTFSDIVSVAMFWPPAIFNGEGEKRFKYLSVSAMDFKWKHFLHYWSFVRRIHQWLVNSPHIGQWRGALMFSLFCAWINSWVNNHEAGDLRCHRAHYDVIVMHQPIDRMAFHVDALMWCRNQSGCYGFGWITMFFSSNNVDLVSW